MSLRNKSPKSNDQSADKAQHYLNVYFDGKQIGYMVIDKVEELVTACQQDEEFANRMIKACTATYRQAGTKQPLDLSDI
ncbi:hypothetical protein MOMA_06906 [Moraxella macacae 0408225]|uniref:Uncharacterized protein n=1 Tax=Moraxella macacae 0408225 TaxID=1230338 RepID=L2F662_9GAMM|nr:hypothetical protein [Moraxella macacae]ELA08271.1 hypothetical protein MOMA_06906 [Moraxella macacae 0408225]